MINHRQARALLDAVRGQGARPPLVAFLGVVYYTALRPGEAVELREEAPSLPERGWGELYLNASARRPAGHGVSPAPAGSRAGSSTGARRRSRGVLSPPAPTAEKAASPLARRPYELRHAAVSTWLNGRVPAPQVASWAGHGVDVLLRVHARCIAGQDDAAHRRVEDALRDQDQSVHGP